MTTGTGADADARVLVFSQRAHNSALWQATQYELEDVLHEIDDVHLLAPGRRAEGQLVGLGRRVVNQGRVRTGRPRTTSLHRTRVDGRYDLFFSVFHHARDIAHLSRVEGWRERCDTAVAYLIELWPPKVPAARDLLRELRHFDHVFVFTRESLEAIQEIAGVPCTYLPTATDTLRFSPAVNPAPRCVDVLSYGRRLEVTHQALRAGAEQGRLTYLHDTLRGPLQFVDHREHRSMTAVQLRMSRFSVVYKMNESQERSARTGGEEGLTTRYFEAAAAGTVVLGTVPQTPDFGACFDWPDAVIEVPAPAPDVVDLVAALDQDPDRLARASRAGVAGSLRRHDWVHRWAEVLDVVGLPHTAAMTARRERLTRLAAEVDGTG